MKSIIQSFYSKDFGYPVYHRITEIISVFFFLVYSALMIAAIVEAIPDEDTFLVYVGIPLALIGGYVTADFASGLVHFLCDNFGSPETPWLGPSFIKSFRDHHTDPKGITRHDFIEVNGSNCLVTLVVLIPAFHFLPQPLWGSSLLWAVYFMSLIFSVFLTNQFHKWAHLDHPPAWIQKLQRMGFILGQRHHSVHHTEPYNKYYCITCGWLNPVLTKLRFFDGLEWGIRKVFRVKK